MSPARLREEIHLFGQGKTAEAAERHHLPVLAEMPIDPALAALTDAGDIESFQGSWLEAAADKLEGNNAQRRAVSFHGAAFAAFCPSYAIHRRKHLLFVGKNSCKIRQDSR